MVRFATDENLDGRILRGLLRRIPTLDVVRVQDTHLAGADDVDLLGWASSEGRVLLTHDVSTIAGLALRMVESGGRMAGGVELPADLPIGRAVRELELLIGASFEDEWHGRVVYLPL